MNGPIKASQEGFAAQAQKQVAAIRRAAERVAELTVSAASGDGLVRVEVGAQGQLRSVRLVAGAYDRMPADQLAELITRLAQRAAAEAAEQAQEIIVLPGRLPAGRAWWEWLPDAAGGIE